jgi:hypothetical protein
MNEVSRTGLAEQRPVPVISDLIFDTEAVMRRSTDRIYTTHVGIGQRLSGYEPRPGQSVLENFRPEIDAFPEYYDEYFKRAMTGGMAVPAVPLACTGPVSYIGQEQIGLPDDRVGEVRGARRGRPPRHRPPLVTGDGRRRSGAGGGLEERVAEGPVGFGGPQ